MLRLRQVRLSITDNDLKTKVKNILNIKKDDIKSLKIVRKSLDARDKNNLLFVYELDVEVVNEKDILRKKKSKDIFKSPSLMYKFVLDNKTKSNVRPIIVGAGPAGLFCAYMLAKYGYKPLVIERGEMVDNRVRTVQEFFKTNKLNINSNVQFGEGGAGTFSDGKLNTSIKDSKNRIRKVLEIFVENGAPEEILYEAMPHIGTDNLRSIVKNIRNKIISFGGEFRFNTKLTNLVIENESLVSIEVNNNEIIPCNVLILAIGHSARDTFKLLYDKDLQMCSKPFAVGVRVQHPQEMINKNQYGSNDYSILPPASYKLTYTTNNGRGVYSFCMCPGGYVVNASSEEGCIAINGMSNYMRESNNANSAIVVTVNPKDFGLEPLSGIEFQRKLEEKAYIEGHGNIPLQTYKDFKRNCITEKLGNIKPIICGNYTFANLNKIFPDYINTSLVEGMENFGKKIKGFNRDDCLLLGVESRTSSPIRIIRDEYFTSNIDGIFPCGEGAGYSGGITSSAIDGIKVAEAIASKYN